MIKKIACTLALLLMIGLFYLFAVTGSEKKDDISGWSVRDEDAMTPLGEVQANGIAALAQAFGAQTPYTSAFGQGTVRDAGYDGGYARVLTWLEPSGAVITSVRPAQAASLIRRDDLSPTGEACSAGGMAGMINAGEDAVCAYFGSVNAAYAVFLPSGDVNALLTLLSILSFTD